MKECIVEFNTAKLAKEKGFEAETHYCYDIYQKTASLSGVRETNHWQVKPVNYNTENSNDRSICAPTQALVQKWLREEHNIYVDIHSTSMSPAMNDGSFAYKIVSFKNPKPETYEQALEKGLQEALKLIEV